MSGTGLSLRCESCGTEVAVCAFCETDGCGHVVCYRCVRVALREESPQPHGHGG